MFFGYKSPLSGLPATAPAIPPACNVDGGAQILSLEYLPISWFLDIC